jgi:hypothetical protein
MIFQGLPGRTTPGVLAQGAFEPPHPFLVLAVAQQDEPHFTAQGCVMRSRHDGGF